MMMLFIFYRVQSLIQVSCQVYLIQEKVYKKFSACHHEMQRTLKYMGQTYLLYSN